MLQDMATKGKADKAAEQVSYATFQKYCAMEQGQLESSIAGGEAKVEALGAEIIELTEEVNTLGDEIAQLQTDVAAYDANAKKEEEQRAKDHAAYVEEEKDYAESVYALERAIALMESKSSDAPRAAAVLLQLGNSHQGRALPEQTQKYLRNLLSVLQSGHDGFEDYAAPEANAYEFQSGGIIGMLKKLYAEFSEKKGECQKEEMNAQYASNMILLDLKDSIENAEADIASKTKLKASKEAKAADLKAQLQATIETLAEDKKTLKDLTSECHEKGLSYTEKQRMRTDEIEAIETAIEILSSGDVSLLQVSRQRGRSFLQVSRSVTRMDAAKNKRRKVIQFLEGEGRRLKSAALGLLAKRLEDVVLDATVSTSTSVDVSSAPAGGEAAAATVDPFAKVKKLIWDLIQKMEEEAHADATHEGWCDTETGKSKVTRNKLNEDIDGLSAEIEDLKATIMTLAEEIAELSKQVEGLNSAMREATSLRREEKAKNKQTIADARAAQKAVAAATAVLKEFYEKAQLATALVQQGKSGGIKMGSEEWKAMANPSYAGSVDTWEGTVKVDRGHKEGMQTFGATYKGQQDQAGGVLALLETIASDFAQLESDTTAAEVVSQQSYEEFMAESKKSVAVKERKMEMDEADKAQAEANLATATADLKATEDELLAADRFYEKLKPQCVEAGVSFKERQAQREAEIKSLKEALEILST